MLGIAIIGMVAGAAAGLLGGIADVTARNAAEAAQSAENRAQAVELGTQITNATEIFDASQEESQAQLDAADQSAQFNIESKEIEQERAVGSQVATNAASGLGGASKEGVVDQLNADFDREIGQLETERAEMLRAGAAQMDLAEMEFTEDTRQTQREADLLTAEADDLDENTFGDYLSNIGTVLTGGLSGLS